MENGSHATFPFVLASKDLVKIFFILVVIFFVEILILPWFNYIR